MFQSVRPEKHVQRMERSLLRRVLVLTMLGSGKKHVAVVSWNTNRRHIPYIHRLWRHRILLWARDTDV